MEEGSKGAGTFGMASISAALAPGTTGSSQEPGSEMSLSCPFHKVLFEKQLGAAPLAVFADSSRAWDFSCSVCVVDYIVEIK